MEDTQKMVDVRGIEPRCPALSTNSKLHVYFILVFASIGNEQPIRHRLAYWPFESVLYNFNHKQFSHYFTPSSD